MSDGGDPRGRTSGRGPAAGWFRDPYDQTALRYWDGQRWTEFVTQAPAAPVQQPPEQLQSGAPRATRYLPRTRIGRIATGVAGAVLLLAAVGQLQSPAIDPPTSPSSAKVSAAAPTSTTPPRTRTPSTTPPRTRTATTSTAPNVRGLTVAQAKARLASVGLVLGKVRQTPSAARPGTVLVQAVKAGASASLGSQVDLVIAVPLPKVPSVLGKSRTVAAAALSSAGFTVRVTVRTVSKGTQGAVLSQSPAPGSAARPGTQVSIVVAKVVAPQASPTTRLTTESQSCTPGYDPCLAPASDYDCAGGSGNGPEYVEGPVRVTGSDPYRLDADHDGIGCE